MHILVTGGGGQVGGELRRRKWPQGVILHAPDRSELDLSDAASIERAFVSRKWAAVINAGAYTAVDRAESDAATAWAVNARGPAALAEQSARIGCPIIHISTDYVFDGSKPDLYRESDPVAPINVYGASKEAGERAVRRANPRHVILRTSWVFSSHGANFLRTMLRLGAERSEIRVVSDQIGSPTSARDLAEAVAFVTLSLIDDASAPKGTFHLANAGETNWSGFAIEIFRRAAMLGGPSPIVHPIASDEYPTAARRPRNSRLDAALVAQAYNLSMRPWRAATAEAVQAALGASPAQTEFGVRP